MGESYEREHARGGFSLTDFLRMSNFHPHALNGLACGTYCCKTKRTLRIPNTTDPPFITVLGNIGAGKTECSKRLAAQLEVPNYQELDTVDTKKLHEFYQDMPRYAFELEFSLLARRVKQQRNIVGSRKGGVQDRSLEEDMVFVNALNKIGHITEDQRAIYLENLALWLETMPKPHLYVYLKASPAICLERIKQRGRPFEQGITLEYLQEIEKGYDELIKTLGPVPVIVISWDKFHEESAVIEAIEQQLAKLSHIHHVSLA